ncbi:hypothetical protein D3C87_1276580 [compost metagenome]
MPFQAASNVAIGEDEVAIVLRYGVLGTHLGVAIQGEDGVPVVMHLAFHRLFRKEAYPGQPGEWSAAIVPLPPVASASVVAILRGLGDQFAGKGGGGPNYGINLKLSLGSIQQDGLYVPPNGSDGHTCATIVADTFRSARAPLVDLETWLDSDENRIWGKAIECMLLAYAKDKPVTQAYGQAKIVKANNQGFRLLPEEVAAASQLPVAQRPAAQAALAQLCTQAVAEMQQACAGPLDAGIFTKCVKQYEQELVQLAAKRKAAAAAEPLAAAQPVEPAEGQENPAGMK